jgi:hypothetical protein
MQKLRVIVKVAVVIVFYYLTYHLYVGMKNPVPALGDSWDYHIPISQSILDGRFLTAPDFLMRQWYYPGSAEAINSILIALAIPLTLSNILATLVLCVSLYELGKIFDLKRLYSLLFALTFVTLNVVVRWLNAVSIDVWMAVFFVWAIILLEKKQKTLKYFLKLGFVSGMIIGTKYTGVLTLAMLFIFYIRKIYPIFNLKRIAVFFLPFSVFGLFWYVRNYLFTGNPFYPLPVLSFPGHEIFSGFRIWSITLGYPIEMFDSVFAEYKLWMFSVVIAVAFLIYKFVIKKDYGIDNISKLYLLGLANLLLYLQYPTSYEPWIMVSSLRYSYTAFIPLILGVFLQAREIKKEVLLGYISLSSMMVVTSLAYHPKLIFIYLPLSLLSFRYVDRL